MGQVAAIDLGRVRVGLAVSDELGALAVPRPPLSGRSRRALLAALVRLQRDENVERFLVGAPRALRGGRSVAADRAARFCQQLADATGVEVELVDERWSSVQAERELAGTGHARHARRARVDGVAAALLLQSWLDARRG
jgi:putative Holliday junction resolvase